MRPYVFGHVAMEIRDDFCTVPLHSILTVNCFIIIFLHLQQQQQQQKQLVNNSNNNNKDSVLLVYNHRHILCLYDELHCIQIVVVYTETLSTRLFLEVPVKIRRQLSPN